MTEIMFDLTFDQLDDGTIRLEQRDYCGGSVIIDLHPAQLRLLAEKAGLLAINPPAAWPRGFLRRLERLRGMADDLGRLLYSAPCFPPGSVTDDVASAGHLMDAFDDLMADYFDDEEGAPADSNDKSGGISVTSATATATAAKRGRPPKGQALSNAERQARHREKQDGLTTTDSNTDLAAPGLTSKGN